MTRVPLIAFVFSSLIGAQAAEGPSPEEKTGKPTPPVVVDVKGFVHDQKSFGGEGWTITKVQGEDRLWKARLEASGRRIKEFGKCGEREDWLRFLVWPPNAGPANPKSPSLLFVLRYSGGARGCEHLDIIDLKDSFRTLFETDDSFNFRRLEDLDRDGWPEVIGTSRRFAEILDLAHADSPYPTLVIGFDRKAKRYLCQNHRFAAEMAKGLARFESAFNLNRPVKDKVPFDPENPNGHQFQFAPLLRWVVEMCYAGESDEAWALLNRYATKSAAKKVREALEQVLESERFYQEMMRLKSRPPAPDDS